MKACSFIREVKQLEYMNRESLQMTRDKTLWHKDSPELIFPHCPQTHLKPLTGGEKVLGSTKFY